MLSDCLCDFDSDVIQRSFVDLNETYFLFNLKYHRLMLDVRVLYVCFELAENVYTNFDM